MISKETRLFPLHGNLKVSVVSIRKPAGFLITRIAQRCAEIFRDVANRYDIDIIELGFNSDHVHMVADVGLRSIPEVAKLLKGTSAKFLLREFRWLKFEKFWGSGLWSPVVYFDSVGQNLDELSSYVRNQGNTASL